MPKTREEMDAILGRERIDLLSAVAMLMVTQPPAGTPKPMKDMWLRQREDLRKRYIEHVHAMIDMSGADEEFLKQEAREGNELAQSMVDHFDKQDREQNPGGFF